MLNNKKEIVGKISETSVELAEIVNRVIGELGEIASNYFRDHTRSLDGHSSIVTFCHTGVRSLKELEILKSAGFSKGAVSTVASTRGREPSIPPSPDTDE